MKRRKGFFTERQPASALWRNPPACGWCRKRRYPSRRDARRALRNLYPGDAGQHMGAYRCPSGGDGWHLGHRTVWPSWSLQTCAPRPCDRCPQTLHIGAPVAHLHGLRLCLDCGDHAERQAITAERDPATTDQEASA